MHKFKSFECLQVLVDENNDIVHYQQSKETCNLKISKLNYTWVAFIISRSKPRIIFPVPAFVYWNLLATPRMPHCVHVSNYASRLSKCFLLLTTSCLALPSSLSLKFQT